MTRDAYLGCWFHRLCKAAWWIAAAAPTAWAVLACPNDELPETLVLYLCMSAVYAMAIRWLYDLVLWIAFGPVSAPSTRRDGRRTEPGAC